MKRANEFIVFVLIVLILAVMVGTTLATCAAEPERINKHVQKHLEVPR